MNQQRQTRDWPDVMPVKFIPVTGFRDTTLRVTYIPWSDVMMGLVGWQVISDRAGRQPPILVYVLPLVGHGSFEIRCHLAEHEPNPETDPLLGTVTIPAEMLGLDDDA
jgi:hypothetical protein